MTNEEKLVLIKQLIEHKRNIDVFMDQFTELFGTFPGNGECSYLVFNKLFNDYIHFVAAKIGETKEGIEWFIWDNDCGEKAMQAGLSSDEMVVIDSAESYLEFINKQ